MKKIFIILVLLANLTLSSYAQPILFPTQVNVGPNGITLSYNDWLYRYHCFHHWDNCWDNQYNTYQWWLDGHPYWIAPTPVYYTVNHPRYYNYHSGYTHGYVHGNGHRR